MLVRNFPANFSVTVGSSQPMMNLTRSNCNTNLNTFPTYILRYVNKGAKLYTEKVFSCGDNSIFSNDRPCVLSLKDDYYLNVWDYSSLCTEIYCPDVGKKKHNKGSSERYKKRFCLCCMVSFSNERLHVYICQGFCEKCLEKVENHLDLNFSDDSDIVCEDCERCFPNEFCFESHKMKKLFGEYQSYCDFLVTLKNCSLCIKNFELNLKCKHFGKKPKNYVKKEENDEDVLTGRVYSGDSGRREYVKCDFCSDFYLKGNSSHSCFLKQSDSILANSSRRSSTVKLNLTR